MAGIGIFLALVALAFTVTPGIANRWVARVSWWTTLVYVAWAIGRSQREVLGFLGQQHSFVAVYFVGILLIALFYVRSTRQPSAGLSLLVEARGTWLLPPHR